METILQHYNYAVVIILMMTGLYVVFASSNLIKKLVGLSVFQTSVFLLYISMGKVTGGKPPIIDPSEFDTHHGEGHDVAATVDVATGHAEETASTIHGVTELVGEHAANEMGHADTAAQIVEHAPDHVETGHAVVEQVLYSNPLPHVLILTAIVVGVATLAIGLALVVRIRETYGTIEEDEIDALDYQEQLGGGARI